MRLICSLAFVLSASPLAAQEWTPARPCPLARFDVPSLVVDDQLYLFGGFVTDTVEVTTKVHSYDPLTDSWTPRADLPVGVTHVGLAADGPEVWMVGGFVGDHPGVATERVWIYRSDLDSWSPGPALPKAVAAGALVRLDRHLHWFGGLEPDRDTPSAQHWALDLDQPGAGWQARAPLPSPRNHLGGVALAGRAHALGGQLRHDTDPVDVDLHHAYDPALDQWFERAPLPSPRSHFEASIFELQGRALIAGGTSRSLDWSAVNDVTRYDPSTDEWTTLPPLPLPRYGAAAGHINGELIVACGGPQLATLPTSATWRRPVDALLPKVWRIDCGGEGVGKWAADVGWYEGDVLEVPGLDVGGTSNDLLYQTARVATTSQLRYRLPVDAGKWRVSFHLAEIEHSLPGQRVLRLNVEGVVVEHGLDLVSEVGAATAAVFVYDVEVQDSAIDLEVTSSVGQPMLNGLQVKRLPDDSFEVFCEPPANSTGQGCGISFKGSGSVGAGKLLLQASPAPAGFGLVFYGRFETDLPFGDGRLCLTSPMIRGAVRPIQVDTLVYALPLSAGTILPGSTWTFQAWYRDQPAGGAGFNTSAALRLRFTD